MKLRGVYFLFYFYFWPVISWNYQMVQNVWCLRGLSFLFFFFFVLFLLLTFYRFWYYMKMVRARLERDFAFLLGFRYWNGVYVQFISNRLNKFFGWYNWKFQMYFSLQKHIWLKHTLEILWTWKTSTSRDINFDAYLKTVC